MKVIEDLKRQIEEGCRFCFPPEKERILYETDHFYVMVSLGPVVEGYLLIVTKEHISACLHLPKEYHREFIALKNYVGSILTEVYGACLFYEHGKVGTSLVGKDHHHCFHAHLHCIPACVQLNEIIGKDLMGIGVNSFDAAIVSITDIDRYLYVEDKKCFIYQPQCEIRSQYLRFRLAEAVGHEDRWNWVENQNWELIYKTIDRLQPYFNVKDT